MTIKKMPRNKALSELTQVSDMRNYPYPLIDAVLSGVIMPLPLAG